MKKLYRYYLDCGRMGSLGGLFVADDELVKKCIGIEVYFGEVLGKHSDVAAVLQDDQLSVLTDDQDFIDKAVEYGLVPTGYDPIRAMIDYWMDMGETDNEEVVAMLRAAGVDVDWAFREGVSHDWD